jgi:hypothetical protein
MIIFGIDVLAGVAVIGAGHDVVENAGGFIVADLQNIYDALVLARNGLKTADAFELAFVGAGIVEAVTEDELHGAQFAERSFCQPNIAVAAAVDAAQQCVLGDGDGRGGHGGSF